VIGPPRLGTPIRIGIGDGALSQIVPFRCIQAIVFVFRSIPGFRR
jgi:hypothetical protein